MNDQDASLIGGEHTVELTAGRHPNGDLVVEKVLVNPVTLESPSAKSANEKPPETGLQLLKSPLFVRGVARADVIQLDASTRGKFSVAKRSGNLCVRVFSKTDFNQDNSDAIEQALTSALEKLGGDLDVKEARALVYSIHVSCGFNTIEKVLNEILEQRADMAWFYGNVYDPESGEPLNWWQSILAPE